MGFVVYAAVAALLVAGFGQFTQTVYGSSLPPLPPGTELLTPADLGLSQGDLDKFLGRVKVLAGREGSGSKTQILTVGFDENEKLNLENFQELSTDGLDGRDKGVVEEALHGFRQQYGGNNKGSDSSESESEAVNQVIHFNGGQGQDGHPVNPHLAAVEAVRDKQHAEQFKIAQEQQQQQQAQQEHHAQQQHFQPNGQQQLEQQQIQEDANQQRALIEEQLQIQLQLQGQGQQHQVQPEAQAQQIAQQQDQHEQQVQFQQIHEQQQQIQEQQQQQILGDVQQQGPVMFVQQQQAPQIDADVPVVLQATPVPIQYTGQDVQQYVHQQYLQQQQQAQVQQQLIHQQQLPIEQAVLQQQYVQQEQQIPIQVQQHQPQPQIQQQLVQFQQQPMQQEYVQFQQPIQQELIQHQLAVQQEYAHQQQQIAFQPQPTPIPQNTAAAHQSYQQPSQVSYVRSKQPESEVFRQPPSFDQAPSYDISGQSLRFRNNPAPLPPIPIPAQHMQPVPQDSQPTWSQKPSPLPPVPIPSQHMQPVPRDTEPTWTRYAGYKSPPIEAPKPNELFKEYVTYHNVHTPVQNQVIDLKAKYENNGNMGKYASSFRESVNNYSPNSLAFQPPVQSAFNTESDNRYRNIGSTISFGSGDRYQNTAPKYQLDSGEQYRSSESSYYPPAQKEPNRLFDSRPSLPYRNTEPTVMFPTPRPPTGVFEVTPSTPIIRISNPENAMPPRSRVARSGFGDQLISASSNIHSLYHHPRASHYDRTKARVDLWHRK